MMAFLVVIISGMISFVLVGMVLASKRWPTAEQFEAEREIDRVQSAVWREREGGD